MNETEFSTWLSNKFSIRTSGSRLANCRRIEQFEGDLDTHFKTDQGVSLIEKLSYSTDDKRNNRVASHSIPINGDRYNGTATFKQAAKLYFEFKSGKKPEKAREVVKSIIIRKKKLDWPIWGHPNDEELYEVIKLTAKYTKFLNPEIVRAIVDDNRKHQVEWSGQLKGRNICPEIYLWENSPCAFPGVRRYAGSKEIAYFRNHTKLSKGDIEDAIRLDDNDFPKQIWSHIFIGNRFQKRGPEKYALAHLADHKEHNNRLFAEFHVKSTGRQHKLFGLFTCPSNTVYIPTSLLRPTDFSPAIRRLLISKAQDLYGSFCNILPPWINTFSAISNWDHTHFKWADPVGEIENIELFLEYRDKTMRSIFLEY
jgi:hypothetical protein